MVSDIENAVQYATFEVKVNLTFIPEYYDTNSKEFKKLKDDFESNVRLRLIYGSVL